MSCFLCIHCPECFISTLTAARCPGLAITMDHGSEMRHPKALRAVRSQWELELKPGKIHLGLRQCLWGWPLWSSLHMLSATEAWVWGIETIKYNLFVHKTVVLSVIPLCEGKPLCPRWWTFFTGNRIQKNNCQNRTDLFIELWKIVNWMINGV